MSPDPATLLVVALFATAALAPLVAAGVADGAPQRVDARVLLPLVGAGVGTVALLSFTVTVFDLQLPADAGAALAVIAATTIPLSVVTAVATVRGRRAGDR